MTDRNPYGHVPADTLASIALDGPRSRGRDEPGAELASFLAHLADCARCGSALRELRRAVAAGRAGTPGDSLVPPPARVWRAVAAEVRADAGSPSPAAEPSPRRRTRGEGRPTTTALALFLRRWRATT